LSTAFLVLGALAAAAVLSGPGVALASHQFADVPNSAFYHDFVDFLARNGLTGGCGGGQFCGEDAVTRGQLAVFFEKLALLGGCSADMVKVGPTCIDKYEASVWFTQDATVIQKIRFGTVTAADLTAAGAFQLGLQAGGLEAFGCPTTGNGCKAANVYAVSIPGVLPARFITWFQAAAAARNAGKRLPTNAEWQVAALGTPDGVCNVSSGGPTATGSLPGCVSEVGAFDMVGNLWEWVADWVPRTPACGSWGSFSDDTQCLAGAATTGAPGALVRGGSFFDGTGAGVFAVDGGSTPSSADVSVGFRAAR
jgi:hypothetical protein